MPPGDALGREGLGRVTLPKLDSSMTEPPAEALAAQKALREAAGAEEEVFELADVIGQEGPLSVTKAKLRNLKTGEVTEQPVHGIFIAIGHSPQTELRLNFVALIAALFLLLGKDPLRGLQIFFVEPVKSLYALTELAVKATPLLLIALGLAVCYRSNVWNIGAEGQFVIGALVAGGVALMAGKDTSRLIVIAILLAGVLGGMAWAGLTAVLRDKFNANEILVSLMLVYVADMLLSYLVYGPWKDPAGYNFPQTVTFAAPDCTRARFDSSRSPRSRRRSAWPILARV